MTDDERERLAKNLRPGMVFYTPKQTPRMSSGCWMIVGVIKYRDHTNTLMYEFTMLTVSEYVKALNVYNGYESLSLVFGRECTRLL